MAGPPKGGLIRRPCPRNLTPPLPESGHAARHVFAPRHSDPRHSDPRRAAPPPDSGADGRFGSTASFCGFTPQYRDLVRVWADYRDRGLVVLGLPSDDFAQEYDEAGQIKEFCELTYGVDFPMTAPVHVRGGAAHPFFHWARAQTGHGVDWNFNKYLIGRDGRARAWMPSRQRPTAITTRAQIEQALAEAPA